MNTKASALRPSRLAGRSDIARKVVRAGWVAKGVVYTSLAFVVLQLAMGVREEKASTTGALENIAGTGMGKALMLVLALGLLAYAAGRVLEVTTLAEPSITTKDKVLAGIYAAMYVFLALTAFRLATSSGGGGSGGGSGPQKGSSFLFELPGGQLLVGLAGLAVIAYGVYEGYKGIQKKYLGTLETGRMSAEVRRTSEKIGTVAYVTKGAIFVLIGYFLVQSALTYDPRQARGLDAALLEVAQGGLGRALLVLVALGLLAYAAFAFLEARYRRIGVSATGTA